jgi:ribosome-interacting GTPase 1
MPANLTPQYHKAEQQYRAAQTQTDELSALQEMLRLIPKHKGTDRLQADLKSKIAKLKTEAATAKPSSAGKALKIPLQGAARILLLGPPNSGKSQMLCNLTRAQSEVADYPFTTIAPVPGIAYFEDCPFQMIDLPPVTADVMDVNLINLVRGADLVFLFADLGSDSLVEDLAAVLERFNDGKTRLGRESYLDEEDLGVAYTRTFLVLNKADADGAEDRETILREFLTLDFPAFRISAANNSGCKELMQAAFDSLEIVRVYSKNPKEKDADMTKPFTVRKGDTLVEFAENIHRDIAESFKSARVWGTKVHPGTIVKRDYEPADRDIVELNTGI